MTLSTETLGFLAATSFLLFTGAGAVAQLHKLFSRHLQFVRGQLARHEVCAGLHPTRELWSYAAFLLFALSGATRSYFDTFLVVSRFPVVICATIIIGFLAYYEIRNAKRYIRIAIVGDLIFLFTLLAVACGQPISGGIAASLVDSSLGVVSVLLFYGKGVQAFHMYRAGRAGAVSVLRELGTMLKDMTGIAYVCAVGGELRLVGLTHLLSILSSIAIIAVKFHLERRAAHNEMRVPHE